jgi:hypothetical protein
MQPNPPTNPVIPTEEQCFAHAKRWNVRTHIFLFTFCSGTPKDRWLDMLPTARPEDPASADYHLARSARAMRWNRAEHIVHEYAHIATLGLSPASVSRRAYTIDYYVSQEIRKAHRSYARRDTNELETLAVEALVFGHLGVPVEAFASAVTREAQGNLSSARARDAAQERVARYVQTPVAEARARDVVRWLAAPPPVHDGAPLMWAEPEGPSILMKGNA